MPSNREIVSGWVADGTPAAEPVTVETPAAAEVPPPAAPADTPAPAADAAPPVAVPPAGATPAQVQEFLDARLGEAPYQLPKGVLVPLKRGETEEWVAIEDLRKRGMMELDYRHKTEEVARLRRETEGTQQRLAGEAARVAAREAWLKEREDEMAAAQKDPEAWAAYQSMQEMYRTNPTFRKTMDDALAKRETDAELAVYRDRDHQAQVMEGTQLAASWITTLHQEPAFQAVDPERVRQVYAQALASGQARLDPADVRAVYEAEARYLAQSMTPLQQQLATLTAEIAAMKAATVAKVGNETTTHAVERAKAPPVAVRGAAPVPSGAPPAGRFGPRDLPDRNAAWAAQR